MTSVTEDIARQYDQAPRAGSEARPASAAPKRHGNGRAGKLAAAGVLGLIVMAWSVVLPIIGLLYLFGVLH